MKLRVFMGAQHGHMELDLVRCECCRVYLIASTANLDGHGHCVMCQEPQEVPCHGCGVLTREDVLEGWQCPGCDAVDAVCTAEE